MTLSELFTSIANAIRSKTGSTGKIKATNFASQISAITLAQGNANTNEVMAGRTFSKSGANGLTGTLTDYGVEPTAGRIGQYNNHLYLYVPDISTGENNRGVVQRSIHTPLSNLGNAQASHVLADVTFSSQNGVNIGGGMSNRGAWGATISPGGSVTIPAGYHNGGGVVSAGGGTNFAEDKSASSSSHYSCTLQVSASELSGKYIAGFCYYSTTRTMGGDSYVNCSFVHNGTTYTPSTSQPSKQTGTLSNSIKYTAYASQRGHAVFFSKPVQLSSIICNCGSGVGQWCETDYLYLTMNGFK